MANPTSGTRTNHDSVTPARLFPKVTKSKTYDPGCRRCPRLAAFLDEVSDRHGGYWCRPVPPFGDTRARLLIVGLAPGLHGANASGRPFTGDFAGILLYRTLHRFGLATRPLSESATDGLELTGCRLTNAVKCLPPANKPTGAEVQTCNGYLAAELESLGRPATVLCLGRIAHQAVLRALGLRQKDHVFGHGAEHRPAAGLNLIDSYHCSRYNTQTRRLTTAMFEKVVARAARLAAGQGG